MARFGKVKRVTSIQMELDMDEADRLLFFLDKARTQMMNDGSNTVDNMQVLAQLEQPLYNAIKE